MAQTVRRIARLLKLPPRYVVRTGVSHLRGRFAAIRDRQRDRDHLTFSQDNAPGPLGRYFSAPDPAALAPHLPAIRFAAEKHLNHRFDLLGSGWVQVCHGLACAGIEGAVYGPHVGSGELLSNAANRRIGEAIAAQLPEGYEKIDWQLDFKSGFRWSENTWYQDIPYGHLPGVDIKVPWELARMQHLPTLVWAHMLAGEGHEGFHEPGAYADEIIAQITDFIAHNPPRFGVNWRGAMDVAIRAANWVVSLDFLRGAGVELDTAFEDIVRRSLVDHGRHVFQNLEWDPEYRANHYLANVVGLLFISAYLPKSEEADRWLAFAAKELADEILRQFNPDGTGFEASTAYHRLAAEMAIYGLALFHAIDEARRGFLGPADRIFGAVHLERLRRAADFTRWTTKPSGRAVQIGDNDNGRFLKLAPALCRRHMDTADGEVWTENHLDFRHLLDAVAGVLGNVPSPPEAPQGGLEHALARGLVGTPIGGVDDNVMERFTPDGSSAPPSSLPQPEGACVSDYDIRVPGVPITTGLRTAAFPDFGLYIFSSERMFLSVRCGPIGLNGRGAHAHNDQLAVELEIDGEDWIADPGSYLYSASSMQRDAYRSASAHFVPRPVAGEPGSLKLGMFWLGNEARAACDGFSSEGFVGHHHGFGVPVYRQVTLGAHGVRVRDFTSGAGPRVTPVVLEGRAAVAHAVSISVPFSPGYGVQARR